MGYIFCTKIVSDDNAKMINESQGRELAFKYYLINFGAFKESSFRNTSVERNRDASV